MNKDADWFAWSLQFLFGLFVGAVFSVAFIPGRRSSGIIMREASPMFVLGAALIGSALASYYGEQLWSGRSYRIIPPNQPRHSVASRWGSIMVGCVGGILVLVAALRSFGLLG